MRITTRRSFFALPAIAALRAAETPRAYARMLPDRLRRLAAEAYARRNAALSKLTSADAIRQRQAWARETFWMLAGGKPEPCAPDVRITGEFSRPGYKVQKLTYETQPGLQVPANLYIPTGSGPFPGVLFQMGHSTNGKAADPYQKCCQGLARLGYVVLAFDPMGQGERRTYPKIEDADQEHTIAGKQMLLIGETATRMQAWDAVASLSVLASHPSVDPKKLTSTGQSGGGTLTMFLIAADDRLAAAAVSSGNTENFACAGFLPPGSVDDAEQDFIGSGPAGFDRWDTLYPMAPKPLLVMASMRDFFGTYSPNYIASGREEFSKLQKVYTTLGAKDKLAWYETYQPHALSKEMRLAIYRFFENQFRGKQVADEPEVKPEAEKDLLVGIHSPTPKVVVKKQPSGKLDWIRVSKFQPECRVLARGPGENGVTIETIEFRTDEDVWLPAYRWVPRNSSATLLIAEPGGRVSHWREGDLYPRLAASGITVVAIDTYGLGDTLPEVSPGNPRYERPKASEDAYAWASLVLGHSMLEQRISDWLQITKTLTGPVLWAARGHVGVPAQYAAALSGHKKLYVSGGYKSYRDLLDAQDATFANYYPNILGLADIPDNAAKGAWDFDSLLRFARS